MKFAIGLKKMGELAPHVAAIISDPEVIKAKARIAEGKDRLSNGEMYGMIMPLICSRHADEVMAIVAAQTDMTAQDVAEMEFDAALKIMNGSLTRELFDFFPFAVRMVAGA